MSAFGDTVRKILESRGMPVRPCGLNADWSVSAWHFGPGVPNVDDGGLYILDDEIGDIDPDGDYEAGLLKYRGFSVVRYYPSQLERPDYDGETAYMNLADGLTILEAIDFVKKNLNP